MVVSERKRVRAPPEIAAVTCVRPCTSRTSRRRLSCCSNWCGTLHVAEKLDDLVRPYLAAQSGLEMLQEGIRTIVLIEARIHDIALVLTAAAQTDQAPRLHFTIAWK